ncbi:MAG: 2,3,4,5-tetrahydropyridine-2,6-dicarboxylate N-succinyltransferase [Balneolaceae bacterium]|nr:MAG: 2,3,4,5-tetrahydropyridine-2,6-dicarboxylate N-succinyltransferase [Balneolaceae bacterium]
MDWKEVLTQLENGTVRAAVPKGGGWVANLEVKEAILAAFKAGKNVNYGGIYEGFVDKDNLPPRSFDSEDAVRLVPGGSSVRRGAYVAPGVIIMPPAYINTGAFVDEGSMVDSHALVGSCAQIGKNVHLSAGVQIGGVLEPVGLTPVVIEDNCFIGAGAVIVEGIHLKSGVVVAPGVTLSKSVPVYDCVNKEILPKGSSIPAGAVIVPGTRPVKNPWAVEHNLSVACPIIIKYRDEGSNASLELENALR